MSMKRTNRILVLGGNGFDVAQAEAALDNFQCEHGPIDTVLIPEGHGPNLSVWGKVRQVPITFFYKEGSGMKANIEQHEKAVKWGKPSHVFISREAHWRGSELVRELVKPSVPFVRFGGESKIEISSLWHGHRHDVRDGLTHTTCHNVRLYSEMSDVRCIGHVNLIEILREHRFWNKYGVLEYIAYHHKYQCSRCRKVEFVLPGFLAPQWIDDGVCDSCCVEIRSENWEHVKRQRDADALRRRLAREDEQRAMAMKERADLARKRRLIERAAYEFLAENGLLESLEETL